MKKFVKTLVKILQGIILIAYAIVAIAVTVLLLSYNEHFCSEIGGYTFIIIGDEELEPDFNKGDLVLIKETRAKDINAGDNIFLYKKITTSQYEIRYAEVLQKNDELGERSTQYILEGNTIIDHEDVIGSTEKMKVIPHLGTLLQVLESKYGYLFLIVVVTFITLLYEIYELVMEIKYGDEEREIAETKENKKEKVKR